ncbi:hypothetical protein BDQ17DRAFT_809943 [Cyathus striatus]|nr:hypothetical protein BDQ17DRAFT_809943 [Cyathus striatus]
MDSLSSLSIFVATPKQVEQIKRQGAEQWARGMTNEQYFRRLELVGQGEGTRNSSISVWVLGSRDNPESLDFVCSCKTIRREGAIVVGANDPAVDDVLCYSVGGVLTPPHHRGRGYARHMLRLIHWVLAPDSHLPSSFPVEWGAPPSRNITLGDAAFSYLWSDVGTVFYRKCGTTTTTFDGWVPAEGLSTVWRVNEYLTVARRFSKSLWTWLDEHGVTELWKADTLGIKEDLKCTALSNEKTLCAVYPHGGVAEMPHRRAQVLWQELSPRPFHWGIISPGVNILSPQGDPQKLPKDCCFASWTLELRTDRPKTLSITRLRCSKEQFVSLISVLIEYAESLSVDEVHVWNLSSESREYVSQVGLGGKTYEREVDVPCFKVYGLDNTDEAIWMFNEKYPWS